MLFLIIVALFGTAAAYSCPEIEPQKDFNITDYTRGQWYEIARHEQGENGTKCVMYDFDEEFDHKHAKMKLILTNQTLAYNISVYPTEENGKILYIFSEPISTNITANVLHTDHKNYIIFYYCVEAEYENERPKEVAWVVSRTPSLEMKSTIIEAIHDILVLHGYELSWQDITPEDCIPASFK